MKNLTVNGIAFDGELPATWSVEDLVHVVEREVLAEGEIVVSVRVDGREGAPRSFAGELSRHDTIELEAAHLSAVLANAVDSSRRSLDQFDAEMGAAVTAFQVGREPQGWASYQRSLHSLGLFVNVAEQLIAVLHSGFADGSRKAGEIESFSRGLGERLREMEDASAQEDVVTLCDCAEDLSAWTRSAWGAVWPEGGQA